MKTYSKIILGILFVMLFTGCSKEVKCPEPIIIHDTSIVEVPTKVKRPYIECSLDTEDDMYDCIVLQKKIIEEITK